VQRALNLKAVGIVLSLSAMLGCNSEVKPEQIAGTWLMTTESRGYLPPETTKASGASGKIVLDSNGHFTASEVPEEIHQYGAKPEVRLNSGAGSWRLAPWNGAQHVLLEFQQLSTKGSQEQRPYGLPLTVEKGLSGITLYYSLGDPDEARRATYERQ
jgi:hypothetical protein